MKSFIPLLFVLISTSAYCQIYNNPNPAMYGIQYQRFKPLLVQHVPRKDTILNTNDTTPQIFVNGADLWYYSAGHFYKSSAGGGGLYEPFISAPATTGMYWNGFKNFVPLNTDSIPEGITNLWYTAGRVHDSVDAITLERAILNGNTFSGNRTINSTGYNLSISAYDFNVNAANAVNLRAPVNANYLSVISQDGATFYNAPNGSNYFYHTFHFNPATFNPVVNFQAKSGTVAYLEDNPLPYGLKGQTIFNDLDNNYIAGYLVRRGRFVFTDAQLDSAKQTVISQASAFTGWQRLSHGGDPFNPQASGQNDTIPYSPTHTESFLYDSINKQINSTYNTGDLVGIVAPSKLTSYSVSATVSAHNNTDNDKIGILAAVFYDENDMVYNRANGLNPADFSWPIDTSALIPNQHTITVIRSRANTTSQYQVFYDFQKTDQKLLFNGTSLLTYHPTTNWQSDTTECQIKVVRAGDSLKIFTTEYADAPGGKGALGHEIDILLTSDTDLYKFRGPTQFGFVAQSQANAYWKDLSYTDNTQNIYDLRAPGNIWIPDSTGTYVIVDSVNVYDESERFWYNESTGYFGYIATDTFYVFNDIKNSANADTLAHEIVASNSIIHVSDISSLQNYAGAISTVIVDDTLRGGVFTYTTGTYTDNGVTFSATGKGSGVWRRQINSATLLTDWYSTVQEAFYADTVWRLKVSSKRDSIELSSKLIIPGNLEVNMLNTKIVPSSGFDNDTLISYSSLVDLPDSINKKTRAISFLNLNLDGHSKNITGIVFRAKVTGDQHTIYCSNMRVGMIATGNTEKQNVALMGITTDTLLICKPDASGTPDENVFRISGGYCGSYVFDSGNVSNKYSFNVENQDTSRVKTFAVTLKGNKGTVLSGEIRGAQKGGVYVSGGTSLNVQFEQLQFFNTNNNYVVYVKQARTLNGLIKSEAGTNGGAVYLGNITNGGNLDINVSGLSGQGVAVVTLGNTANSERVRKLNLRIVTAPINDTSHAIDIDNIEDCNVLYTGTAQTIKLSNYMARSLLNLPASYLQSNIAITNSLTTNTSQILFGGSVTVTVINSYSTPIAGMRIFNVSNSSSLAAYYNGTAWLFESNDINISSPAQGNIAYYDGGWQKLAKNSTATRYLANTGSNNDPAWAQINLSNGTTGILPAGSLDTSVIATKWYRQKGIDSIANMVLKISGGTATGLIKYSANYGSSYDARTLVDKNYVDSSISANIGKAPHFISTGGTPSILPDIKLGTGGIASISGSDAAMQVVLTGGTGASTAGQLATITFNTAYTSAPKAIIIQAADANATTTFNNGVYIDLAQITTTGFVIQTAGFIAANGLTYTYYIQVIQ